MMDDSSAIDHGSLQTLFLSFTLPKMEKVINKAHFTIRRFCFGALPARQTLLSPACTWDSPEAALRSCQPLILSRKSDGRDQPKAPK